MIEIFANRKLMLIFLSRFTSNFGDGFKYIIISWLTYERTQSVLIVAISLALFTVPGIIITPFAGMIVDIFDRRLIGIIIEILQFIIMSSWILTFSFYGFSAIVMYIFVGLLAIGQSFILPTLFAILPELFDKKKLLKVNATMSIAMQSGFLIGTSVGGAIIAIIGTTGALIIDALTYLFSAVCIFFLRSGIIKPKKNNYKINIVESTNETVKYLKQKLHVINLVIFGISTWTVTMVLNVLLAPFSRDKLFINAMQFGVLDSALGVGSIIGGYIVGMLKNNKLKYVITLGFLSISIFLILFGFNRYYSVALLLYFLIGFVIEYLTAIVDTQIQIEVENEYMGRISSLIRMGGSIIGPTLMVLVGTLAEYGSFIIAFLILSLFVLIITGISFYYEKKNLSISENNIKFFDLTNEE
ncbi:MFS transporter [Tepidibacillus infernus]|uniref:MFS transporter n=1 Tax=Tepidibacillus infernus TaxID=1806172 RepID=UPI003B6D4795